MVPRPKLTAICINHKNKQNRNNAFLLPGCMSDHWTDESHCLNSGNLSCLKYWAGFWDQQSLVQVPREYFLQYIQLTELND